MAIENNVDIIVCRQIDYNYPAGGRGVTSLSWTVGQGALIGLVGANGSGKSTLLSLLAGLYTPTRGELVVGGAVSPGSEKAIRRMCRMVMQDADVQILGATTEEDLLLGRPQDQDRVRAAQSMAKGLGLLDVWDKPVQTLSWGMKRKLCLAAALLDEPQVLLLDEPFSGLDYPGKRQMRDLIEKNRQAGLTQILSSHDVECLVDMVDSLAVLAAGRLVLSGAPEEVLGQLEQYDVRPPCSWQNDRRIQPWDNR